VAATLDSVRDLLGETLGSGYRVRLDRPETLPLVQGDRAELETVIVNLVLNARDAMPGGGEVVIAATLESASRAQDGDAPPVELVSIAVIDSGVGMSDAVLARASEAFFTTKAPGKGTGLGLAMARAFAEELEGDLVISSEPGRGTTVTVRLPLARPGSTDEEP
jgi:two-component system NtrC family sensor kinase